MGELSPRTCPHGMTPASCLICETLAPGRRGDGRGREAEPPARRGTRSLGWAVAGVALVALVVVLVASWAIALVWSVFRLVQLVVVAIGAGWVGWRLGVRHRRRHPG